MVIEYKDDLERLEDAFNTEQNINTYEPDRIIDYMFIIEGATEDKERFWQWYINEIDIWLGEGIDRDNCVFLYGSDFTREHLHNYLKVLWQWCICPLELSYDQARAKLNLTMQYEPETEEGDINRTSLVGHCWILEVVIKNFMKPFNLVLSGWFDNSHKRYVFKDNVLIEQQRSNHYITLDTKEF